MSDLTIKPNLQKQNARIREGISAGEHVSVTIADCFELIEEGLRFRVVDKSGTVAIADEFVAYGSDITFTLNLNTAELLASMRKCHSRQFLFVLDNPTEHKMFFSEMHEISRWVRIEGTDEPQSVDEYPSELQRIEGRINDVESDMTELEQAASQDRTTVENLRNELNTAKSEIKTVKTNVENNATKIGEVKSTADKAETAVGEVENIVTGMKLKVSDVFDMNCSDWAFREALAKVWKNLGGTVINEE